MVKNMYQKRDERKRLKEANGTEKVASDNVINCLITIYRNSFGKAHK